MDKSALSFIITGEDHIPQLRTFTILSNLREAAIQRIQTCNSLNCIDKKLKINKPYREDKGKRAENWGVAINLGAIIN
jgi:hypothetical protein